MPLTVYGASDDLIEIDGDIYEEFGAYDHEDGDYLAFSDGTCLHIVFDDDGVRRIKPVAAGDHVTITQAPADDDRNHTDRAVIDGDIRWVVRGTDLARKGR